MKKLLCIILCLAFILTGCSGSNKEKAIRFDINRFPNSLDAQMTMEKESIPVLLNTMSGLTKIAPDGSVVPDLAEKWEVKNGGREYIFTLKDDLKWQDGTPLTSRDFQFALRRVVSPKTHSPYAERYLNILNSEKILKGELSEESLGVRTPDDKTLIISLNEPDLSLPSLMAQTSSLPCNEEFFNSCKGKYGLSPENLLSCGPFYLHSVDENLMLLKKNTNALSPAKTEKLYFCTRRGEHTDIFLEGRSEACIVPFNEYEKIKDLPKQEIYNRTFALVINPESEIGKNEIYRKALVSSLFNEDFSGEGEYLTGIRGIVPPSTLLENINYREKAGDLKIPQPLPAAKLKEDIQNEILNESSEKLPKTEITTDDSEINFSIASKIQNIYSTDLSLYINIVPQNISDLSQKLSSKDFEIALCEIKPVQDKPLFYLAPFGDIEIQLDGEFIKIKDILQESETENDSFRKIQLLKKAEQALIDNFYVLPLYHAPTYIVSSDSIEGLLYLPSKQAFFFGDAVLKEK